MANTFLLRDNLNDYGEVPSKGSYYSSPDLIVHELVADPQAFFESNYDSDVNQRIKSGAMVNFIYGRVKNLGTEIRPAFLRLYAAKSSLFMTPSRWKPNVVKTAEGEEWIAMGLVNPGNIAVTPNPFAFNAQNSQTFCHVGYVSSDPHEIPDIPDRFNSYDEFVHWIHLNPHIALRNFSVIYSSRSSEERLDDISNPTDESKFLGLRVTLTGGFPKDTLVEVNCPVAGIKHETKVVAECTQEVRLTWSGEITAGGKGYVHTIVFLPKGAVWPQGGILRVEALSDVASDSIAAPYALSDATDCFAADGASRKLVLIGMCSSIFYNNH